MVRNADSQRTLASGLGRRLARLALACLQLGLGLGLGLVLLEVTLQLNPSLLLRGMAAAAPIEAPLTIRQYSVRLADADLFFWHGGLIRPIAAADNVVEAVVDFRTDEFGFANHAPSGPTTDVVILGRSYSLGAQAAQPWPQQLAALTSRSVTNLSQAAIGIDAKHSYLRRFGLARQPRWVILEVLPSMDLLGYTPQPALQVPQLPVPLLQAFARQVLPPALPALSAEPIYPLPVTVSNSPAELVFFSHYLSALTVSQATLAASRDWAQFQAQAAGLIADARSQGACVALLYAPTKEEIYFPLVDDPNQLAPVLRAGWRAWQLNADGRLTQDAPQLPSIEQMQAQTPAARNLLGEFAAAQGLALIDPSEEMRAAALRGDSPFMRYDSHWSHLGHSLVAQQVAAALAEAVCP